MNWELKNKEKQKRVKTNENFGYPKCCFEQDWCMQRWKRVVLINELVKLRNDSLCYCANTGPGVDIIDQIYEHEKESW